MGPESVTTNSKTNAKTSTKLIYWHKIKTRIENKYFLSKISLGKKSYLFERLFLLILYVGKDFFFSYKEFRRKCHAVNLPFLPSFFNNKLPDIELTIDCVKKDLPLLGHVISHVLKNSMNPITHISIVTPLQLVPEVTHQLKGQEFFEMISIIPENEIVCNELIDKIRSVFPHNSGWVLHQFLTLQQILNSRTGNLLSLDADTIILRKFACVDLNRRQILMESLEYNSAYYNFLFNAFPELSSVRKSSHVSHYSFFQKRFFLKILDNLGVTNLHHLFELVCTYAELSHPVPICIDREIYAYGMLKYFPSFVEEVKFGNLSVNLMGSDGELSLTLRDFSSKFNSVSAHAYLQQ